MPDPDHSGQPKAGARLVRYEPWPFPNASLTGLAKVDFDGWVVARIPIFRRGDGSLSVGTPNAAEVDLDGRQRVRPDGKRQYWAVVSFANADAKERWQRAVLGALDAAGVTP